MKRKECNTNVEACSKKPDTTLSSDLFRSKIAGKLQTILDGLTSEIETYSEDRKSDVTSLKIPEHYEQSISNKFVVTRLGKLNQENRLLANFIDKAKSKLSELLIKERKSLQNKEFETSENWPSGNGPECSSTATAADPLQVQITQRLQTLFNTTVDRKINNVGICKVTQCNDVITDCEWKDLSVVLQGFMSSAKKKISAALSKSDSPYNVHHQSSSSKSSTKENLKTSSQTRDLRSFRLLSHKAKVSESSKAHQHIPPLSSTSARQNMMSSPIHSESDNFDMHYSGGGVLLLEDAERAPEYLRLTIDSDVDEPDQGHTHLSDSEEDVVVLGEKRPTYQEITLEEDEGGAVRERVVEKEKEEKPPEVEETLYECPSCEKSFRVESLLKFHIKMHTPVAQHLPTHSKISISSSSQTSSKLESDKNLIKRSKTIRRHSSDKRDDGILKSSHKHKRRHNSHKRRKHKKSTQNRHDLS